MAAKKKAEQEEAAAAAAKAAADAEATAAAQSAARKKPVAKNIMLKGARMAFQGGAKANQVPVSKVSNVLL